MATLEFERGDAERPVGHAFLYFTDTGDRVGATYILVPPIVMDLAKYIPPLLASSLGPIGIMAQQSFVPVPPAPESASLAEIRRLAELRGDDVLVAGRLSSFDVAGQMSQVAGIGEAYAQAYQSRLDRSPIEDAGRAEDERLVSEADTNALLYSVLPEHERLDRLAHELVTLQYATEVSDEALAESTRREMQGIAAYMPKKYWLDELLEVLRRPQAQSRLVQLYFDRAYRLTNDDLEEVPGIEAEIMTLRGAPSDR